MAGVSTGMMLAWLLLAGTPAVAASPRYDAEVINPDLVGGREIHAGSAPVLLLWGTDATILRSEDGRQWTHTRTTGAADLALLAANSSGAVIIAVGTRATILRSSDAGRTWVPARVPAIDSDLKAVISAGEGAWIAAGTNGRILRSVDEGKTWAVIESRLTVTLHALSADPASGRVMIGGDDGLVGFSGDRGVSWQVTSLHMEAPVTPVTAFHRFDDIVLATSARGRFLISRDDGDNWELLQSTSNAYFTGAAFDSRRRTIVLTGHNGDVVRSTDGGLQWDVVEVIIGGTKNFLGAIEHDPRSGAFLATGAGHLLRSTDGGATWTPTARELRGEFRGLMRDSRGVFLAYGVGGVVASSIDAGVAWRIQREPLDYLLREVLATPEGHAFVATSRLGDVLTSGDQGRTWKVVTPAYPNPNTPPDLRGLVIAPSRKAMIAVGPPGVVLRADAHGRNWQVALWHDIEAERAFPWVLSNAAMQRLVIVDARGAMQVSHDDGINWLQRSLPLAPEPGSLPFWQGSQIEKTGLVLVAGEDGEAARSTDGGETWQVVDTGSHEDLFGSFADERSGHLFLAGARGTLLLSEDAGVTWERLESGSDKELRRFHRDARTGTLLCFGAQGELLHSRDGRKWTRAMSRTQGVLRKAISEPVTGHLLLVGGQGTLLRSADGGRDWESLATHTTRHFSAIAADESSGDLVLIGERIVRLVRQSARR